MGVKKSAPKSIRLSKSHSELLEHWNRLRRGELPDDRSGKPFESLVLRAFEIEGAQVTWPFSVKSVTGNQPVEQIDGAICADGLYCLIECKDWSENVDVLPITKLRNQLMRRPSGVIGTVFSGTGFTSAALELARYVAPQTILLWDGEDISFALERRAFRKGLLAKYSYVVEHALPDGPLSVLLPKVTK